jgi:hypothetical protein
MAQTRQTPKVWSDAIRGSEGPSNRVKLGTSTVLLTLLISVAIGFARTRRGSQRPPQEAFRATAASYDSTDDL